MIHCKGCGIPVGLELDVLKPGFLIMYYAPSMSDEVEKVAQMGINIEGKGFYGGPIVPMGIRFLSLSDEHLKEMGLARLETVIKVIRGMSRGDCYCEVGIGNPMYQGHTDGCKAATEFMTAVKP